MMTMTRVIAVVVAPVLIGLVLSNNQKTTSSGISDFWMSRLFPFGFPQSSHETNALVDPPQLPPRPRSDGDKNYDLQALSSSSSKIIKIYERGSKGLLRGPETIVFGPSLAADGDSGNDDAIMYTLTDQGFLISLTDLQPPTKGGDDKDSFIWTAETTLVKDLGCGRPLGAKFTTDGSNTLYVADAVLGLIRIQNPTLPTSKVEIVASKIFNDSRNSNNWTRINYADDLTIGPKTGRVYFTDASEVSSPRNMDMTVDVMYGSKIDSMRGPSGRMIQYDPKTDELKVLMEGIWFANGVGVDVDETYLVVGETFRFGLIKYHLTGPKAGTSEYIVKGDPLNAYVDGVDCAWPGTTVDSDSKPYCYAANPSEAVPAHKILLNLPPPIDRIAKSLLMLVPKELAPHVVPYGGVTIVDGETGSFVGRIEDPTGQDITKITGVTVHDNKLYLGSLENNYIGVYSLS